MTEHRLEMADVIRQFGREFLGKSGRSLSIRQRRVLRAIETCRTAELGGHRFQCDQCGQERIAYNSCRDRHCPKCQAKARAEWLDARAADLLPVPYFHAVFTLPDEFGPLALQNPRVVYGLLFRAAWETLRTVAADPKHLGARIGCLMVLHTWGQNLMHHPHVHCVVPGGGLSPGGTKWVSCRRSRRGQRAFLLPVRVLSRVFRGKFIALLKQSHRKQELVFHGRMQELHEDRKFESMLNRSVTREWVVYCKPPFGGPEQVLKYLARYTHRVAISNNRLLDMNDRHVRFRWKNYARQQEWSTMTLEGCELIRRFLLHVLPSGFVRIRHFGLLANRRRSEILGICRQLLGVKAEPDVTELAPSDSKTSTCVVTIDRCPHCGIGHMQFVESLPRGERIGGLIPRARPP